MSYALSKTIKRRRILEELDAFSDLFSDDDECTNNVNINNVGDIEQLQSTSGHLKQDIILNTYTR